ncbi:MAG: hypothetical protein K6L81_18140 [Agarilytica sp.]
MLDDIYFIDVKGLCTTIRLGELTDKMAVKHFIVFSMVFYSGFSIPFSIYPGNEGHNGDGFYLIEFCIHALIHLYGIWHIYKVNLEVDGKDFLNRLFCLALPISIWLGIVFFTLGVVFMGVFYSLFHNDIKLPPALTTTINLAFTGIYPIVFYYSVAKHLKLCSNDS